MSTFYLSNDLFQVDFLNDPFVYLMGIQGDSNLFADYLPFVSLENPMMFADPLPSSFKQDTLEPTSTCSSLPCQNTNHRPKTFSCSYCNRSFARKYDVARHKRIHTGFKPYTCPCCNKSFARSDARVRHFRTEVVCRNGANKLSQKQKKSN